MGNDPSGSKRQEISFQKQDNPLSPQENGKTSTGTENLKPQFTKNEKRKKGKTIPPRRTVPSSPNLEYLSFGMMSAGGIEACFHFSKACYEGSKKPKVALRKRRVAGKEKSRVRVGTKMPRQQPQPRKE
mgnify:CR=1 FL=1